MVVGSRTRPLLADNQVVIHCKYVTARVHQRFCWAVLIDGEVVHSASQFILPGIMFEINFDRAVVQQVITWDILIRAHLFVDLLSTHTRRLWSEMKVVLVLDWYLWLISSWSIGFRFHDVVIHVERWIILLHYWPSVLLLISAGVGHKSAIFDSLSTTSFALMDSRFQALLNWSSVVDYVLTNSFLLQKAFLDWVTVAVEMLCCSSSEPSNVVLGTFIVEETHAFDLDLSTSKVWGGWVVMLPTF